MIKNNSKIERKIDSPEFGTQAFHMANIWIEWGIWKVLWLKVPSGGYRSPERWGSPGVALRSVSAGSFCFLQPVLATNTFFLLGRAYLLIAWWVNCKPWLRRRLGASASSINTFVSMSPNEGLFCTLPWSRRRPCSRWTFYKPYIFWTSMMWRIHWSLKFPSSR